MQRARFWLKAGAGSKSKGRGEEHRYEKSGIRGEEQYLDHLLLAVGESPDDEESVEEVQGDAVGRVDVGASDLGPTWT